RAAPAARRAPRRGLGARRSRHPPHRIDHPVQRYDGALPVPPGAGGEGATGDVGLAPPGGYGPLANTESNEKPTKCGVSLRYEFFRGRSERSARNREGVGPVIVVAHRGASGYAPENTLAALALARGQGADMAEIDV